MTRIVLIILCLALSRPSGGEDRMDVWSGLAPGETTRQTGVTLHFRPEEVPKVTRVTNITFPTVTVHPAPHPNGTAAVILPGGGYARVVTDKEGTEIADWLNRHGVTAFVLSYRTKGADNEPGWLKPVQDAQRTLSLIRSQAEKWKLHPDRIGLIGFSAGGQAAARVLCDGDKKAYERVDTVDDVPHRPDFALLIYPWNLYDGRTDQLAQEYSVPKNCPPTFLLHTDDDRSSSLGSVLFYAALKRHGIPAELHVYGNGGHGYGLREIPGSRIATWPDHAAHWLDAQGLLKP